MVEVAIAKVGVAIEFASRHPNETLIVVTGDHETGGMTIGHATTAYTAYYDRLLGQKNSYEHFQANQWAEHKAANSESICAGDGWQAPNNLKQDTVMLRLIADVFGMDWADLNAYQKEKPPSVHEDGP